MNNYSNGYINFTNINLGGSSIDKTYSFSNAYLTIPYTIVVANDGTNIRFKVEDQANIYAASLKSSACIVDWISCKFDGAQLTRSSYHNHLMMNEKLKTYNNDKFKIYGDIMGHTWDNGAGINYVPTGVGEVNNNILAPTTSVGTGGLNPTQQVNSGHIERCRKNVDTTKRVNSSLNTFLSTNDTDNINLRDNMHQSALVFSNADTIIFQGIATIPLSQLHSVFESIPTLSSINGFDLRLQCNLAREKFYTMSYPTGTGTTSFLPSSVTVVQSIGKICPIMVANPSTNGSTGIAIQTATAAVSSITARSFIGWTVDNLGLSITGFSSPTAPPCRIHLPTISFTSDYIKDIANAPQYSLKYNDYYVDTDLAKKQTETISRLFNTQLTRPRILYIIPFLAQSTVTNTYPSCLTSPLSSAPITCTPCRLKNFNIQIGGKKFFNEPQQFNYQFYNNNAMSIMSDILIYTIIIKYI
jgi:hypothetical protein